MGRINILDYMRFIAAMTILVSKYTKTGVKNAKVSSVFYTLSFGIFLPLIEITVPFFMIISGYFIFGVSQKIEGVGKYFSNRFMRIYVPYFVAVCIIAVVSWVTNNQVMHVSIKQLIANLTLFPERLGFPFVDGTHGVLLVYEIKFYLLVGFLLFFGKKYVNWLASLWPMIMIVAYLGGFNNSIFMGNRFSYIALGLSMGAMLRYKNIGHTISFLLSYIVVMFHFSETDSVVSGLELESFLIMTIVVLGILIILARPTYSNKRTMATALGNISYPIYLMQAHMGYMLISYFANDQTAPYIIPAVMMMVVLLAIALHKAELYFAPQIKGMAHTLVEKPIIMVVGFRDKIGFVLKEYWHKNIKPKFNVLNIGKSD